MRFALGYRYLLNNQVFRITSVLLGDNYQVENQSFGGLQVVSYAELLEAWQKGQLQFEVSGVNTKHLAATNTIATEYTISDFQALSQEMRAEAWRRYRILQPLLKLPPHELTRKKLQAYALTLQTNLDEHIPPEEQLLAQQRRTNGKRAAIGQAVSCSSIESWLRTFRASHYDIRALVPRTKQAGGVGDTRLDAQVETLLEEVFAECLKEPHFRTIDAIFARLANRLADANRTLPLEKRLELPSATTVYRRIKEKKLESILQRQHSTIEKQQERNVGVGPEITRPLERVEIDHTCLDLLIVDEQDRLPIGRPTLTFAIDVYTGLPFGCYVGFEPASYQTVMLCLLHGILPKADCQTLYGTKNNWPIYGLPETLVVDNGKEFRGQALSDACGQLGIQLDPTPVKKPWFKGSVERYFGTVNTGLVHMLPGTTFSNIMAKGDYDAAGQACISLNSFWEMLHLFLLDVYAWGWNNGLEAIPVKRWQESVQAGFKPSLPHSVQELKILLLSSTERTIQRTGIDFESLRYQSPEFVRLRSEIGPDNKVRIKYDPADISSIYVADKLSSHGWLRVEAVDQDYTKGLSLWKHRIIREYILREKHEVDIYALAEAKQKIQAIAEEEFRQTRKHKRRKTAARILGIGQQPDKAKVTEPSSTTIKSDLAKPEVEAQVVPETSTTSVVESTSTQKEAPKTSESSKTMRRKARKEKPQPAQQTPLASAAPTPTVEEEFVLGTLWGADYKLPKTTR